MYCLSPVCIAWDTSTKHTFWYISTGINIYHSNRYAREAMTVERFRSWREITLEDVKAFLGFSLLMGINRYFSKLQVYTGKADSPKKALQAVVKELMAHLHGKKHHMFNFLRTSSSLWILRTMGFMHVGQHARKDRRGLSDMLKTARLTNRCVCVDMQECACVYVGGGEGA